MSNNNVMKFDENFIDKYRGKQPPWGFGALSYIVYKRTYSQFNQTEEWWQTLQRVVEGAQEIGADLTKSEMEKLYDYMFNLKCSVGGRVLWQMGTDTVRRFGANSLLNCFAGETKVLTRQGWKEIQSLAGQTVELVTSNGKWVSAPIRCFGKQKLYKITFQDSYSSQIPDKTIYATADHDWIVSGGGRIKTKDLSPGETCVPIVNAKNNFKVMSSEGIKDGISYGEGNKDCLPDINEDEKYLLGFLSGLISVNGDVHTSGEVRLFNHDKSILYSVKDYASVCGIRTSEPIFQEGVWCISFYTCDFLELMLIKQEHRVNFNEGNIVYYKNIYKVISVEETDREEDVYCATVDDTHSFVIEGNILTGNCWYVNIDTIESFLFLFENLMLGGGVGFSVKREHVHEFPKVKPNIKIKHERTADADFIVPDSREGWRELIRKALESFFITGKSFTYSTIIVRGAGEKIKTFGGVSSGPLSLIEGIEDICKVLSARENKKIRSIDALDICNILGKIVVSGNVRRCLPAYSRVMEKESGYKKISDIEIGDNVLTVVGWKKVSNVFYQGKQKCIRVFHQDGYLDCTPNHKVAVGISPDGEIKIWKNASELINGDMLISLINNEEKIDLTSVEVIKIEDIEEEFETYDIEVEDEHSFICEGVLVHNSAELAIGDIDDVLFLKAKRWDLHKLPSWRSNSNNSVYCDEIDDLLPHFWDGFKGNGECYGLINIKNAKRFGRAGQLKKDPTVEGFNPCAEEQLAPFECCNLSELFLNNIESEEELFECASLLYKVQKAICNLNYLHEETEKIVHKNMRIGIGVTGVYQSFDKLKWLSPTYDRLVKYDEEWSKKKGYPVSIRLTTVKPSGTLSNLSGSSPGGHPAFGEYIVRNVRFATNDPLVGICKDCGYNVEYEIRLDGTINHDVSVVSFPCRFVGENVITEKEVSVEDQMNMIKNLQTIWSDSSVSCTIYFEKDEVERIKNWLKENYKENIKSISFGLKTDAGFVQQMPLIEITKEEYDKLNDKIKNIDDIFSRVITGELESQECSTGACPVK